MLAGQLNTSGVNRVKNSVLKIFDDVFDSYNHFLIYLILVNYFSDALSREIPYMVIKSINGQKSI